jgi:hypothetical protein
MARYWAPFDAPTGTRGRDEQRTGVESGVGVPGDDHAGEGDDGGGGEGDVDEDVDVDEGTMQAFRQLAHPDFLASNQSTLWDSVAGKFDVLHSIKAADGRMDYDRLLQGSAARCARVVRRA